MENLENAKNLKKEIKEQYSQLYYESLHTQLEEYDSMTNGKFEDVDEEIMQEIDEKVEPILEEVRPDLYIKRIGGLKFLIIPIGKVDNIIEDTE